MDVQRLYFDDFAVGEIRRSARAITLDRDRIVAFAAEFDPHPGHLGEDSARESSFGELVASGWQTASTMMRLIVETMPIVGGGMGGGVDVRWLRPVRPGDALSIEIEILAARPSASKPQWGVLTTRTTGFNQHGEPVATLTSTNLLPRRPA